MTALFAVSALPSTALALPPGAAWTGQPNQANATYGLSVAGAGDVNGDGYADVIAGAHQFDAGQADEGGAAVYLGAAAGLSVAPAWTMQANQAGAHAGTSVAGAGDVNGDGYDDVLVGLSDWSNGQLLEGAARLYLGGPAGLQAQPAWTDESDQTLAWFGRCVAGAGDVNGDGFDDVLVGAQRYSGNQVEEGRAFLYLGSAAGLQANPAWTAESNQSYSGFAFQLSSAGDVNGDGYDDVAVGAYAYDGGQADEGRVYVYLGSAAGLQANPAWTAEPDRANSEFGMALGPAGDVNGDGFDDLVVGSPNYSRGQVGEGVAFLYLGSANGLGAAPAWTGEYDQPQSDVGAAVAGAGDLNGDGFDDVIVGAPLVSVGQNNEGAGLVYFGSAAGLGRVPGVVLESNQAASSFGISVAAAGDTNGDGRPDVVVGAHEYDNGQTDEGAAFLFLGR